MNHLYCCFQSQQGNKGLHLQAFGWSLPELAIQTLRCFFGLRTQSLFSW
jgi:hypothetical protein